MDSAETEPKWTWSYILIAGLAYNCLLIIILILDFIYYFYSKANTNLSVQRKITLNKPSRSQQNSATTRKYVYSQEKMKLAIADLKKKERGTVQLEEPPKLAYRKLGQIPRVSLNHLLSPAELRHAEKARILRIEEQEKAAAIALQNKPVTDEDWFPDFRRDNIVRGKYDPLVLRTAQVKKFRQRDEIVRSKIAQQTRRRRTRTASKSTSSLTAVVPTIKKRSSFTGALATVSARLGLPSLSINRPTLLVSRSQSVSTNTIANKPDPMAAAVPKPQTQFLFRSKNYNKEAGKQQREAKPKTKTSFLFRMHSTSSRRDETYVQRSIDRPTSVVVESPDDRQGAL